MATTVNSTTQKRSKSVTSLVYQRVFLARGLEHEDQSRGPQQPIYCRTSQQATPELPSKLFVGDHMLHMDVFLMKTASLGLHERPELYSRLQVGGLGVQDREEFLRGSQPARKVGGK